MKRHYLRRHSPAFFALLLIASPAASAQDPAPTMDLRSRWGGHIGLVEYGTGDDNCSTDGGLTFGAEVRTRGVWVGAVGVDLAYAGDLLCELALPHLIYRGEIVNEYGRTRLSGAPRLRVRFGRSLTAGGLHIAPALGVGLIHSTSAFGYPPPAFWNAWVGGSVTLRPSDSPVGLEVEYGVHQVRQWYSNSQGGEVVREFNLWKPLFRISLVR